MKKQLAFLLVLALCLSLVPGLALADGGDGGSEEPTSLDDLLVNRHGVYVEVADRTSEGAIIADLLKTFESRGYDVIEAKDITVESTGTTVSAISGEDIYTFSYKVTYGDKTSDTQTGYILESKKHFLLRFTDGVNEHFQVVDSDTVANRIVVPNYGEGYTMEMIGRGNTILAPMGAGAARTKGSFDDSGRLICPFYSANFHILNFMPPGEDINLYACHVIQTSATGFNYEAEKKAGGTLKTVDWDLDSFADFSLDEDLEFQVFFGNDVIKLSPMVGIEAGTFTITPGNYEGYKVTEESEGEYSIEFLSNFHDRISVEINIGGKKRNFIVQRVGVKINEHNWAVNKESNVFHGTQNGSNIDFSTNEYQIFASYHMPNQSEDKPHGLFVTKTYQNGTVETELITEVCNNPHESWEGMPLGEGFENGIFKYNNHAWVVDYLIHAQKDATNAPVKVNVLVLAGDPKTGGGVTFGSGVGVTWKKGD